MALTEVAETIFQENLNQEQNDQEKDVGAFIQDRSTSTKDKVVPFRTVFGQTQNQKKIILLVLSSQEIVWKYTNRSRLSLTKKWRKVAKLQKPLKLVSRTMQLVLFFEMKKSLEQLFQRANFNKK